MAPLALFAWQVIAAADSYREWPRACATAGEPHARFPSCVAGSSARLLVRLSLCEDRLPLRQSGIFPIQRRRDPRTCCAFPLPLRCGSGKLSDTSGFICLHWRERWRCCVLRRWKTARLVRELQSGTRRPSPPCCLPTCCSCQRWAELCWRATCCPVVPLVILAWIATLWRRVRYWKMIVVVIAVAFAARAVRQSAIWIFFGRQSRLPRLHRHARRGEPVSGDAISRCARIDSVACIR